MRRTIKMRNSILILAIAALLGSCGKTTDTDKLKAKLERIEKDIQSKTIEAAELKEQIRELDPEFSKAKDQSVLVNAEAINKSDFRHKIQVQGEVASRKNITLAAETMGSVEQINVTPGDMVKRNQLLVKIDASTTLNRIQELKTALDLAKTIFNKQKNLWEQEIGTEVQYLEARNRKETLERQLATAQSQLDMAYVRAPFNGRINDVNINIGELVQPGLPIISMVSQEEMYLKAAVSEEYINDFDKGDSVEVYLPSIKKSFSTVVSSVSYVINPANRTFQLEVKVNEFIDRLKPNQFARLTLVDYENESAIVVPSDVVQQDNIGDFVFIIESKDNHKKAKKVRIERGKTYNGNTEILKGINEGDVVITDGYREAVNGIDVRLAK
ncbi:efflux RND transporter periplasmic adaptor subunit [Marivirga arenosa]|uniref:Efflux RND transporter periplasmic adaptor subunit n=1 Tax=Marivirga arenosa TaxID=3059076 RepID=A0AA51X4N5_9BACT|nr:efflux RND transporter periplasmic adaptor subunit [Marivirga sp. BKB1-2]WNB17025.1 efflux RND transporter periplasmic adaptor subunit [Marivirga sp. BKB1-2]